MQCPHCDQDTDPTLAFCMKCGEAIELDAAAVQQHFEKNEEMEAVEFMEGQTRSALYVCAFLLVTVVAFRLVVIRPFSDRTDVAPGYMGSSQPVLDKNVEPPTAVDIPKASLDIPDWRPTPRLK
jgi:hypothetical protein